jgi:hypothetical protein
MADFYRYEPETGMAYPGAEAPFGPSVIGSELLAPYDYSIQGYYLIPNNDPTSPIPLGRQAPIGITIRDNGIADITSYTTQRSLNRAVSQLSVTGIEGSAVVVTPDGQEHQIDVQRSWVAGVGQSLYSYVGADGVQRFEGLVPGSAQAQEFARVAGPSFRLATAGEAERHALAGYIRKNYSELVERLAGQLAEQNGTASSDEFSAALNMLLDTARGDFQYVKWTKLD